VEYLELALSGQLKRIPNGGTLEMNPKDRLAIKNLLTNRWKNYDLLLRSPDLDVNSLVKTETTLLALLGLEAFGEAKVVTIEALEGEREVGRFTLKAAFSAWDWGGLAQAAVEPERKIEYYRKALALTASMEPAKRAPFETGLREALEKAGKIEELIGLLEGDLTTAPDDATKTAILAKLLTFYREKKDQSQEIQTLTRLLVLAEKNGQDQRAQALKAALANLRKLREPQKSADLYEELYAADSGEKRRSYLLELLALYKILGQANKEESVYVRLLPLAEREELAGLWGEIVRLREKLGDQLGQIAAWASLADILPQGETKANAYKRLGFLRYENNELIDSEKAYLLAIEHGDDDGAVYLNLARLALARQDRSAYRDYLSQAFKDLKDPAIQLELAEALTDDGLKVDALSHWESLAALPGSEPGAAKIRIQAQSQLINLQRPPAGQITPEFENLLYSHAQHSVEFYNLGVSHFQAKNWDGAIKAFLKALELNHKETAERAARPEPQDQKDPQDPQDLDQARARIDPNDPKDQGSQLESDARGYLLALYKEKGQTQEMLEQANWIYPADPQRHEVRDLIADQLERDKNWAGLAKLALEWTGQDDEAANWRILANAQQKLGQNQAAAQSLLKVAQRESKAANWLKAAQALQKVGSKVQAKAAYERVLDLEPGHRVAEEALLKMALERINPKDSGS
jgi:tetratricopeptide (TPR) repeat protein